MQTPLKLQTWRARFTDDSHLVVLQPIRILVATATPSVCAVGLAWRRVNSSRLFSAESSPRGDAYFLCGLDSAGSFVVEIFDIEHEVLLEHLVVSYEMRVENSMDDQKYQDIRRSLQRPLTIGSIVQAMNKGY